MVAQAARNALSIRYRLIDYFYTAFHAQHLTGTPVLSPLFFKYPTDTNTYPIDLQYFFGPSVLVNPITEENATTVQAYIPDDVFYDFYTLAKLQARGGYTTFSANLTEIPLAIRGGNIIPMRVNGTMTTTELRKTNFELIIAPNDNDTASGNLYYDDGLSLVQNATTEVGFAYGDGTLTVNGTFDAPLGVNISKAVFLGVQEQPQSITVDGEAVGADGAVYDGNSSVLAVALGFEFSQGFTVSFS